jgi:hypothetical protein
MNIYRLLKFLLILLGFRFFDLFSSSQALSVIKKFEEEPSRDGSPFDSVVE